MKVYIDTEFKCHVANDGTMTEIQTDFFDGKCKEYIEGFRYIPFGATWISPEGRKFRGLMVSPWKPIDELEDAQRIYEKRLLAEYAEVLKARGISV